MKRKFSQRVVCATQHRIGGDAYACEVITQDARRRHRPITGIVGHRTARSREEVRNLAKAEGASLIVWVSQRLCYHDGTPHADCKGADCKKHGRCCWQ